MMIVSQFTVAAVCNRRTPAPMNHVYFSPFPAIVLVEKAKGVLQ
jgi:hypothetical protein